MTTARGDCLRRCTHPDHCDFSCCDPDPDDGNCACGQNAVSCARHQAAGTCDQQDREPDHDRNGDFNHQQAQRLRETRP